MPKYPPSAAFEASLHGTQRRLVRLWKIAIPQVGTVLRYVESDTQVSVDVADGDGVQAWQPAPGVTLQGEIEQRMDLQVERVQIMVPNEPLTLGSLGTRRIAAWAQVGVFDDALVDLYYYDEASQTAMWHSRFDVQGNPAWSFDAVTFELESWWARVDRTIPKTLIQEACNNRLYDPWCGVNPVPYTITAAVTAVPLPTRSVWGFSVVASGSAVPASGLPDQWLALGAVRFTTGALAPLRRMIARQTGMTVEVTIPMPSAPTPGALMTLTPGCDKTVDTCQTKFDNVLRFRGFPYVPRPDSVFG